jgi:amidophosphoribosyltransferase
MEKQRNRGQDGAGIAVLKQHMPHGTQYFHRHREAGASCLDRLWKHVHDELAVLLRDRKDLANDDLALKRAYPWLGEVYLGHLRYGTHGVNGLDNCHPYVRTSNWPSRLLSLAGNFNLTNTPQLFDMLVTLGQHPTGEADTATVMEKIGHFLDVANEAIVRKHGGDRGTERHERIGAGPEIARAIADDLDIPRILG